MIRRLLLTLFLGAALVLAACDSVEERAERHFDRGVALLEAGESSQALLEFRNVLRLQEGHAEARTLMARTLRAQGDTGSAFREYLRLVEQYPDTLEGQLALAEIAAESGDWEAATRHGRAAQELAPEDADVVLIGAVLDYRDAVMAEDRAATDAPAAIARAYLETAPETLIAWRLVVDHALNTGDPGQARTTVAAALEARPDVYEFHGLRLRLLAEAQEAEAVTQALQEMIARFPENAEPRTMLVSWHVEQGDLDAAEGFLRDLAADPEAGTAESLTVVEFLRQTRGEDAALAEIDRLIAAGEAEPRFQAMRAGMIFERGDTAQGIAELEALLEEDAAAAEETGNLRILLARMRQTTGDVTGARALVEEILQADPRHVEALKMRAAWLIDADRPGDAISALRTAQAEAPRDPQLMTLMGQAHERDGDRTLAGERYALAVEMANEAPAESLRYARFLLAEDRPDSAEAVLASALARAPQNIELMRAMAEVQLRRTDWDRVTRLVWQLRAIDSEAAQGAADAIEAELLLRQGRTDDTIDFLEGIVREGGSDVTALARLVQIQIMNGQIGAAQILVSERLAETPDDPTLRFLRAGLHLLGDEVDEAEAIYRALVTEHPSAEPPLRVLHGLLIQQGRADEATAVLDAAIAAAPGAPMPLVLRAGELERQRDFEGAITIYEELYAANSANLIIANNLASLISTHRDDDESLARAHAIAQRLRGTDVPAFQDTYGWIQYRRGNYAEALEYLQPAAAGLPDDPLVQYHLGMTYLALDRPQEARDTLTRALDIAGDASLPQFDRARSELARLDGL